MGVDERMSCWSMLATGGCSDENNRSMDAGGAELARGADNEAVAAARKLVNPSD
jgi:hypothetical protein